MSYKSRHFLFSVLSFVTVVLGLSPALASQQLNTDRARARAFLDLGVQAFRNSNFDEAIQDFKQAKLFDPLLTKASVYMGMAYAEQYVPGGPSDENRKLGRLAVAEYKAALDQEPTNLVAIDGIGRILYTMADTPFDPEKMEEAKSYNQRHIEIMPNDPEPHYWIGVIDFWIAFHTDREIREGWVMPNSVPLAETDPLPEVARQEYESKCGEIVDEGIASVKKAISLKPDYDDAMAYLNLLYRKKAEMESSPDAREADSKTADAIMVQVKTIKEMKAADKKPQ